MTPPRGLISPFGLGWGPHRGGHRDAIPVTHYHSFSAEEAASQAWGAGGRAIRSWLC